MKTLLRTLLVMVAGLVVLGALSACSGGSPGPSSSAAAPAPPPKAATYVADMEADGKKMTIGISVDGDRIAAYACNGVDDEAWFFGTRTDGKVDVTNKFRDTLAASFVGSDLTGSDLTGNVVMNGTNYTFTAAAVADPAGVYTVDLDGIRSSWIVRPDGSVTGVQFNGGITGRDFEQAELQQLNTAQFQAQVRNKRVLQQADQAVSLQNRTLSSKINGRSVTARTVTGSTRFG
ncbi:hypothetical protein ASD37_16315 [Mycobacterium sp. Root135]|uniref:hypothetical protein n=1 Tax=Mycobacterium sp. Root135 TaxID=1736457 RepID=UPI0006F507F3|nr:hypothetical protein [Mycobacterium sp. Root135]KQY06496.1 hypothetical protein ASD37_16315 [Mycobacterium sp. Root135]